MPNLAMGKDFFFFFFLTQSRAAARTPMGVSKKLRSRCNKHSSCHHLGKKSWVCTSEMHKATLYQPDSKNTGGWRLKENRLLVFPTNRNGRIPRSEVTKLGTFQSEETFLQKNHWQFLETKWARLHLASSQVGVLPPTSSKPPKAAS